MPFDPKKHVGDFKGRAYMDVASRLLWINEDADRFEIESDLVQFDEARAVVKATVTVLTAEGQRVKRAVAHGLAIKAALPSMLAPRYIEKAETSAVGRALSMLGYGTQYAQEFDDATDEHLADSPRQTNSAPAATGAPPAARQAATAPPAGLPRRAEGGPATRPPDADAPPARSAQASATVDGAAAPATRAPAESAPAGGAPPVSAALAEGRLQFAGGTNERGQQFIKACRDHLGLEMPAVQQLLAGKVGDYMALLKLNGEADASYERVYTVLRLHVEQGLPVPYVAVSPAVAALRDDLVSTPA